MSVLLVALALLEVTRNAGWQGRGEKKALEANRRAKEEFGASSGTAASLKKKGGSENREATASAEVRVGSGSGGGVEGKKKA